MSIHDFLVVCVSKPKERNTLFWQDDPAAAKCASPGGKIDGGSIFGQKMPHA
jgi:hypothetical protein